MTHLLIGFLLYSQPSSGPETDWSRVQRLRLGTRISITYVDGASAGAFFAGANDTTLMVRHASGPARAADVIPRERIRQLEIERRYRPAGGKAAVVGACVTLGLLFIERAPAGLKVLWMPIGALVGYTAAPVHEDWKVIYRQELTQNRKSTKRP